MPVIVANGTETYFELTGPDDAPVLVLSHALGVSLEMWDAQCAALEGRFRILRYDLRGHGRTKIVAGPATVDDLVADLVGLLDRLFLPVVHFAGLSLGGRIGQAFAASHPSRVKSLSLLATAAHFSPQETYSDRAARVRCEGLSPMVEGILGRWFTPAFHTAHSDEVAAIRALLQRAKPEGYAIACEAVANLDIRPRLADIRAPTMVIAGEQDPAATPACGEYLQSLVAGAALHVLSPAAHLLNIEQATAVNALLDGFITTNR